MRRCLLHCISIAAQVTSTNGSSSSAQHFSSDDRFGKERGFGYKMRDIPVLTGNPRPVAREESWRCAYRLTDRMEDVVQDVLRRHNWDELEIQREMEQIYERKRLPCRASLNPWSTVEEFQRTPWYRRFRPSDTTPAKFISYEAMKLLEEALIPPSLRTDPYAHLRKRHMEDHWMNDNFSEDAARYVSRAQLARQTKGMPQFGSVTRKAYVEFADKFKEQKGSGMHLNEVYSAWTQATNPTNNNSPRGHE